MTVMNDLIGAALAAADLFREGDTPDQPEIRVLVRAADAYQGLIRRAEANQVPTLSHEDSCLMCAVRALTEGDPAAKWNPTTEGATISGVVLRQGEVSTNFGVVPFVDLWTGGTGQVRVMAYAATLRHELDKVEARIGDRLQVRFNGERTINRRGTTTHGRTYKAFSANVQRGH